MIWYDTGYKTKWINVVQYNTISLILVKQPDKTFPTVNHPFVLDCIGFKHAVPKKVAPGCRLQERK